LASGGAGGAELQAAPRLLLLLRDGVANDDDDNDNDCEDIELAAYISDLPSPCPVPETRQSDAG